jgi:hypothetical protein
MNERKGDTEPLALGDQHGAPDQLLQSSSA